MALPSSQKPLMLSLNVPDSCSGGVSLKRGNVSRVQRRAVSSETDCQFNCRMLLCRSDRVDIEASTIVICILMYLCDWSLFDFDLYCNAVSPQL